MDADGHGCPARTPEPLNPRTRASENRQDRQGPEEEFTTKTQSHQGSDADDRRNERKEDLKTRPREHEVSRGLDFVLSWPISPLPQAKGACLTRDPT